MISTEHQERANSIIQQGVQKALACRLRLPAALNLVWVNERSNRLGYVFDTDPTKIYLNIRFIGEEHFWKTTILHEFAHLLCFINFPLSRQAHGPEFRYCCRVLGIKEDTKAKVIDRSLIIRRTQTRVPLSCPSCSKEYKVAQRGMTRLANSGRSYICPHCRVRLVQNNA